MPGYDAHFEIYSDKSTPDREFRWRFRAANGEVVADGEGYTTKANCRHAIEVLQREAPGADIQDLT